MGQVHLVNLTCLKRETLWQYDTQAHLERSFDSPWWRIVLQLRFGLKDGQPHTLEEVGHKFSVTRERIRAR